MTQNNKRDYDRAIADHTQAIKLDPDSYYYYSRGNAYYQRGMTNNNKGDYDKAIADYEEALRIEPDSSDAKQGLEKTKQARGE
jgi:tetratricopeptide (TPR) repeat protein